jgi:excisionase family DNA binding protein
MPEDPRFLTPAEVATILEVHQKTVHQWLRTGKLEGTKSSYRA